MKVEKRAGRGEVNRSEELEKIDRRLRRLRGLDRWITAVLTVLFAALLLFVLSSLCDMWKYTRQANSVVYHDFRKLLQINPDTVAWLKMEGTAIDHPVVRGRDNSEYLDKDFNGNTYAGGTLFLDYRCSPDFSDGYSLIHGHHMINHGMFGDLDRYQDEAFFRENKGGSLLTPMSRYDLLICGCGSFNAYDSRIYHITDRKDPRDLIRKCGNRRKAVFRKGDKLLVLSTCAGDMSDDRIIVFCRMRRTGKGI